MTIATITESPVDNLPESGGGEFDISFRTEYFVVIEFTNTESE